MTTFAIAGIQMDAPVADNLDRIGRQVDRTMARFPWIQMILFGELCVFGPRPSTAQSMPGPAEAHLCGLACKHGIWLVPGSMYELADGQIFNTSPVINPDGEVVARYRKMYPFLPFEKGVAGGAECLVFDVPEVGRFGLSICYDSWFPETTRTLAWLGAEVVLHPTLTNTIDRDLELSISRASAITNQCYFVDINSCGDLAYGRSLVVGPEGDVIHQAGDAQEIIPVIVDFARVRRTRRNGLLGMAQPLKSFRDAEHAFPPYAKGAFSRPLESLGDLEMPGAGTKESRPEADLSVPRIAQGG
jgi:predicted amidohydrolase